MPETQPAEPQTDVQAPGSELIRLASEAYEDAEWFFDLLKEVDASPFQYACAELMVEGCPPALIAHKLGRGKREVRMALDQVRQRLSQRVYEFDAEAGAFARFVKFCIRNKGMQELPEPDLFTRPKFARAPQGMDMVPASDRRLRQGAFDALRLFVEGRMTPEADRLSVSVRIKELAPNGSTAVVL